MSKSVKNWRRWRQTYKITDFQNQKNREMHLYREKSDQKRKKNGSKNIKKNYFWLK